MKEAQNILTEQDPPVIYYGQVDLLHDPPQGHPGIRRESRSIWTASSSMACLEGSS